MGSLLALHLAAQRPQEVQAIVALAPALRFIKQSSAEHARWFARLPFLPRRLAFRPKPDKNRITPAYDHIPVRALASMLELQDLVRSEIGTVFAPCFILTGALDETIHEAGVVELKAGLGSTQVQSTHYPASGHILTEDADAAQVLFDIVNFLEGVAGTTPA
jgi:esterase/lipase